MTALHSGVEVVLRLGSTTGDLAAGRQPPAERVSQWRLIHVFRALDQRTQDVMITRRCQSDRHQLQLHRVARVSQECGEPVEEVVVLRVDHRRDDYRSRWTN